MKFIKLDTRMLDSSLWGDREAREIFITALLMAKPFVTDVPLEGMEILDLRPTGLVVPPGRYGIVDASAIGIIRRCGMDVETGLSAVERLSEPDPHSRTADLDGRRLVRTDGGFIVVTFAKHYDPDETAADRQRRWREKKRSERNVTPSTAVMSHLDTVTSRLEGEGEVEVEKKETPELAAGVVGSAGWIRDAFDRLYSAQSNTVARRRRAHDEMGPVRTWSEENVAPLDAKARAAFEAEFTRAAKAFFADSDPFVVKLRANLPYFLKNFDKYAMAGAPKKSNAERPPGYFFDPSTLR